MIDSKLYRLFSSYSHFFQVNIIIFKNNFTWFILWKLYLKKQKYLISTIVYYL